jgi:quercetin dioxygenase-like cupin family protein
MKAPSSTLVVDAAMLVAAARGWSSGAMLAAARAAPLRVTELTLAPGGYVGEHNHVGPGIREVTSGKMTYVLPDRTVLYGPGDFFFESGDVNHTVFNKTNAPMVHLLFEILPADLKGPSLIPVKHH